MPRPSETSSPIHHVDVLGKEVRLESREAAERHPDAVMIQGKRAANCIPPVVCAGPVTQELFIQRLLKEKIEQRHPVRGLAAGGRP